MALFLSLRIASPFKSQAFYFYYTKHAPKQTQDLIYDLQRFQFGGGPEPAVEETSSLNKKNTSITEYANAPTSSYIRWVCEFRKV